MTHMTQKKTARKAVVVGLGGHCKSVIAVLESCGLYQIEGLYDTAESADLSERKLGYPVRGTLLELLADISLLNESVAFVAIGDNMARAQVFHQLLDAGFELPDLVAPTAFVHPSVSLGGGNVIGHFCMLNAGSTVGQNNIINTRSTIEHDVVLSSHCHVAPSATLCGKVQLADHCFIGAGAVVMPNARLAAHTTIGAGAVMRADAPQPNRTYVGTPARVNP